MSQPTALTIVDPAGRLPREAHAWLRRSRPGVLWVPDRGVPLHPISARRLAELIDDKPLSYVPTIPTTSDIGLPRYEPLLYWLPDADETVVSTLTTPSGAEAQVLRQIGRGGEGVVGITDTTPDEQVYYFADHYRAVSSKPIQVSAVVGTRCNLRCVMCPYHGPGQASAHTTAFIRDGAPMPWDTLARLAGECGALGIPVKMGNIEEPLMHPRLVEFVALCRARGCPGVHVTTNGVLLDEDMSARLLDAGITSVYVSVDAARRDTYRRIRGGPLERTEGHVRSLLRLRREKRSPCRVLLSFVRNPGVSKEEVGEFCRRWVGTTDGVILYHRAIYEAGNARYDAINDLFSGAAGRQVPRRWPCLNPWQEMYILPDGRVDYCCETVAKRAFADFASMGQYPGQPLADIWLGESFTALRRALIVGDLEPWPACSACDVWMAHVTRTSTEGGRRVTRNMITEIIQ
jgi:hypothetical protein